MAESGQRISPCIWLRRDGCYHVIAKQAYASYHVKFDSLQAATRFYEAISLAPVKTSGTSVAVPMTAQNAVWMTDTKHHTEILECDVLPGDSETAPTRQWFLSIEPKAAKMNLHYYLFSEQSARKWLRDHGHVFTLDQLDEIGLGDPVSNSFLTQEPPRQGGRKKKVQEASEE